MIFLTYNDAVTGIFQSQVVDVSGFLKKQFKIDSRIIACFPSRIYNEQKELLKKAEADATAVRTIFPLSLFKLNKWALVRHLRNDPDGVVLARGPFACSLAIGMRDSGLVRKVIYDGRGAVAMEFQEYSMGWDYLVRVSSTAERASVCRSDFRIAVSDKLVNYWRTQCDYKGEEHVVIPTTLNTTLLAKCESIHSAAGRRSALGFGESDTVFVYAGGNAEWQSMKLAEDFVRKYFEKNPSFKLLILAKAELSSYPGFLRFKDRIAFQWVPHEEIIGALAMGDYGLLLRENTYTNKVASPTKFAEYLAAGLEIIISPNVGDYSSFVEEMSIGKVWRGETDMVFGKPSMDRKRELMKVARENFEKGSAVMMKRYKLLCKEAILK